MLADLVLSLPWWGWILLIVFLPVIYIIYLIAKITIVYQFYKRRLPESIARHPATTVFTELFDTSKPVDQYFEGFRNSETGMWNPLVNTGPYLERPYVFVNDADGIKQILTSNDFEHFPKLNTTYDMLLPMVGDGLVSLAGDQWHRHRHLLTPLFHFHVLKSNAETMINFSRSLVAEIETAGPDVWHNAKSLFATHALRIIVALAFGNEFDIASLAKKYELMNRAFAPASLEGLLLGWTPARMIPFSNSSKLVQTRRSIEADVSKTVAARRELLRSGKAQLEDQTDLVGVMILSKDEAGTIASDDEIMNECLTFLFAGYDTSASTMSMMTWMLGQNPRVQAKLHEELDQVLRGQAPTIDDLNKLKYLKNVFRETMRLFPIVPYVDRVAKHDTEICGVKIPAGTGLGVSFFCAQRDPRFYEEPDKFIPERWDDIDSRKSSKPFHAFAYAPFSAGNRNCIGQKFAQQEIMITMAMVLQKFSVEFNEAKKPYYSFELVSVPTNLEIKLIPRSN